VDIDTLKKRAAHRAVEFLKPGMVIGLGSGSTTKFALERIAELLGTHRLEGVRGVPSSEETAKIARSLDIPLTTLDENGRLDVNIDGADEVDPQLNLIKGGGGALLREKVLAQAARRNIIIVDGGKLSPRLGVRWPVPVEVLPFALKSVERYLISLGASVNSRRNAAGRLLQTDQGNAVLDADFGPIPDPIQLAECLADRAGLIEHGLFIGLTHDLIVADANGIRHLQSASIAPI
jgi:ribose 5-phosphate isomerase A